MEEKKSPLYNGQYRRGYLPHIRNEGKSYFVTFRLVNTLPQNVLRAYKEERNFLLKQAEREGRDLTWEERKRLFELYASKVESYLDAGYGECWLKDPKVARMVAQALGFFHEDRYDLAAFIVMPNHVHALLRPFEAWTLSGIIKSWKGYTASKANVLLLKPGTPFWQREYYDHWIRDDEEKSRFASYIHFNPVKAGLCKHPEDWPWSSAFKPS